MDVFILGFGVMIYSMALAERPGKTAQFTKENTASAESMVSVHINGRTTKSTQGNGTRTKSLA